MGVPSVELACDAGTIITDLTLSPNPSVRLFIPTIDRSLPKVDAYRLHRKTKMGALRAESIEITLVVDNHDILVANLGDQTLTRWDVIHVANLQHESIWVRLRISHIKQVAAAEGRPDQSPCEGHGAAGTRSSKLQRQGVC